MRRGPLAEVTRWLDQADKYLATNSYKLVDDLLVQVESTMPKINRIHRPYDRYRAVVERLRVQRLKPCACWYCGFTAEQKRFVTELTEQKAADLDCIEQSDHDHNLIGAYAEVVFGVKFNLPINRTKSPDGGVDFRFHCEHLPSGMLTADVKGTVHNQFRLPAKLRLSGDGDDNPRDEEIFIPTADRYEEDFIRKADHAFVFMQVVDRAHAFFRGFAFGNDEFRYHGKRFPQDQPGYKPKELRPLEEFLVLVPGTLIASAEKRIALKDEVDGQFSPDVSQVF